MPCNGPWNKQVWTLFFYKNHPKNKPGSQVTGGLEIHPKEPCKKQSQIPLLFGRGRQIFVVPKSWSSGHKPSKQTSWYVSSMPQASPNHQMKGIPLIKCWFRVWGMFQGYVAKVLDTIYYFRWTAWLLNSIEPRKYRLVKKRFPGVIGRSCSL